MEWVGVSTEMSTEQRRQRDQGGDGSGRARTHKTGWMIQKGHKEASAGVDSKQGR